jgi:hypothetical protein
MILLTTRRKIEKNLASQLREIMSELLSFYLHRPSESSRVVEQNQQYIKRSINLYPPVFSVNLEAVSLAFLLRVVLPLVLDEPL